jgi:iron complex outermembrane receptor protein
MKRHLHRASVRYAVVTAAMILGGAAVALAQNGKIEGRLTSAEGNDGVTGATVTLKGTTFGAKSSKNGDYTLSNVPAGSYTIVVRSLGYQMTERAVQVTSGGTTKADFELAPQAIEFEGVAVTSDRERSYVASITSTASKTTTPLRDIPASIQVVSAPVLRDQGVNTVDQSIGNVSGVVQSSSSNYGFFNNYNIRGLRMRFLRDGIPDGPTTNGYARTLTDVDRVEVLKGPGSAIYGSSEPGGSINLVSKPAYTHPGLSLQQTAGSFGAYRTTIDAGTPIGDNVRTRISAAYGTKEGYRGVKNRTIEVLPSVSYLASSDHVISASVDYRNIEQDADTYGIQFQGTNVLDVPLETRYYTPFGSTEQTILRGAVTDAWRPTDSISVKSSLFLLHRNLHLARNAGGTITATSDTMTGRRLRDQVDSANDIIAQIEPTFHVTTGSISHTILAGAEFQQSKVRSIRTSAGLPNIVNIHNPIVPETTNEGLTYRVENNRDFTTRQYGLFLQDQVTLLENLKVRVGGRFDQFDAEDIHYNDTLGDTTSDPRFSYQAGVVYQPVEQTSFYAGYARGHLSTVNSESGRISEPESSSQIELGNKTMLLDGLLSVNVAVFDVKREHFNITIGTEQMPVGEQRTRGFEFDMAAQPTEGWGVTANYSYNKAEITNNPADTGAIGKWPVGVPKQTAGLWTTYTIKEGMLDGLGFGGGLNFRDAMFLDAHNTRSIPSYVTEDVVIFYRRPMFELQLNITNIGDVAYFRNGVNNGALPGDPRAVQGTFRLNL